MTKKSAWSLCFSFNCHIIETSLNEQFSRYRVFSGLRKVRSTRILLEKYGVFTIGVRVPATLLPFEFFV